MTPEEIVKEVCGEFYVPGKQYPYPLPPELVHWYCYTSDGGHSIAALLDGLIEPNEELWQQLCPLPVKTLLRGYRIKKGFVVAEKGFRYDSTIGLRTSGVDDEF